MKALTPLLNVRDAARSVSFYCEKLGFEIDKQFDDQGKLVWAHISSGPRTPDGYELGFGSPSKA